jgi:hypothetical protein
LLERSWKRWHPTARKGQKFAPRRLRQPERGREPLSQLLRWAQPIGLKLTDRLGAAVSTLGQRALG